MLEEYDYVIIGGGIAGTSCAQRLCTIVDPSCRILILSASSLVKSITNLKPVTKFLNSFDVEEKSYSDFTESFKNLTILIKIVSELDTKNHLLKCSDNTIYKYKKLCICTGGRPKLIDENNPFVLGIRDTETVIKFQSKLKNAKQIIIVGNGGIATELAYEIQNCCIIWVIKDSHISHTFFDPHSAKFFEKALNEPNRTNQDSDKRRHKYTISKFDSKAYENEKNLSGSALGPDWSFDLKIQGASESSRQVNVEYKAEIKEIFYKKDMSSEIREKKGDWPIYVELTNGKIYGCDFIVSATGVIPSVEIFTKNNDFELGADGGLKVNDKMQTNIQDVFAAGDVCTASWNLAPHWFQMRLWSQALQMGDYAARSMFSSLNNQSISLDFCFEMFAHITNFFNFKIILLGNYDAKGLGYDYQLLIRCTDGIEYVKIVIYNGRVQGALLIGETDLEETFENLILNQIDVSPYGEDLINPDIDIDDYFD